MLNLFVRYLGSSDIANGCRCYWVLRRERFAGGSAVVSEKLRFTHRDLLYERLRTVDTQIAEYSFSNLYLFRDTHEYEVILDKELFVKGLSYDGYRYLMPTRIVGDLQLAYLKSLLAEVDFLFPIPENWLSYFSDTEFSSGYRDGDMDYIYTVDRMSTYHGRALHKKRNLLKQFLKCYKHVAASLSEDRREAALFILQEWQSETGLDIAQTDYLPCREALNLSEQLMLCGGIFYADDEPAGFVLGEQMGTETFVLHFAKARKKFRGVYQYMFNNFARILPAKYRYLNFEQDIDRDSLRSAKASYAPDYMLKKFRVSLRKDTRTKKEISLPEP